MELTDTTIRDAQPRDAAYRLRDEKSDPKGFGIAISPDVNKTFFLSYISPTTGEQAEVAIGRHPGIDLEEAREKAKVYRNRIAFGVDPVDGFKNVGAPEVEQAFRTAGIADRKKNAERLSSRGVNNVEAEAMARWQNQPATDEENFRPEREGRASNAYAPAGRSTYASGSTYARGSTFASGAAGQEVSVAEFFRKLWIKKGLIFATVLICMAATAVILSQVTPRYFSESLIMIEPRANKVVDVEAVVSGLSGDSESIQSEILVIRSRDIAQRVIISLGLDADPEFNTALAPKGFLSSLKEHSSALSEYIPAEWLDAVFGDRDGALQNVVGETRKLLDQAFGQEPAAVSNYGGNIAIDGGTLTVNTFLNKISVRQKGRSRVISIGATSVNPVLAAEIPNVLGALYLDQLINQKVDATQQASSWLEKRISVLQKQVAGAEAAVEQYRTRSGLLESRGATVSSLQVAELSTQLIIARTKTAETRARLDQTRRLLKTPNGILSSAEVLKSPFIQKLREREADVQSRVAELSNEYGERHPKMISVRAELLDIKRKIDNEAAKIINGMSNEVQIARAREKTLSVNLEKVKSEMATANKAEVKLRSLEREATASRSLLETFLSRYKETSAQESQDAQRADARIISAAAVPIQPSFPNYRIILVLALAGSLGLGVLLVFLTEILDKGFRSSEQIESLTGVPVFGLVPLLTGRREKKAADSHVVHNPISHFSEAIRTIYTSLLLSHVDSPPRKILITSSQPDEGKTTITMNLARMQAMAGRKVLVIEADLRRPGITKALNLDGMPGLVELLLGEVEIEQALYQDPESGSFVIPAGKSTQNPPTLLTSDKMSRLIDEFDQYFDIIFLDSPPVLAVSDARILATKVDATVMVVRWADTSRDMVVAAIKQLGGTAGSLAGVVMSMVDVKKTLKYKYGDSFYYQKRINKYYTYSRE